MSLASTETYLAWAAGLLFFGAGLAGLTGAFALAGARRLPYFQLRRQTILRGWSLLLTSVAMLIAAGATAMFGKPIMQALVPPTSTPTASITPSTTPIPPTDTPRPTITLTPSHTASPTITPSASDSPTPTLSSTPALPQALITAMATITVTPPSEAVAADIRFSLRDNCDVKQGADYFDQVPKTIYAHFYYDNWLPGALWAGVWYRDGQVIYAEAGPWNGSTGGCGFTNYDNRKEWWTVGTYEVQIFVGERWLISQQFTIVKSTPTPTITATRTPRPTATPSPAATR